jgi:L,D-transpeptidase catalytic domain
MKLPFSVALFCATVLCLLAQAPPSSAPSEVVVAGEAPQAPRPSFGASSRQAARSYVTDPRVTIINPRILPAIWWRVDPSLPITKLEIRLSEQKLYLFQSGLLVGISPISSGKGVEHQTPAGNFKVLQRSPNHKSNLYGSFVCKTTAKVLDSNAEAGQSVPAGARYVPSPMPHFLRLTNRGVGLHAGYLPGFAASHGCIRLPDSVAADIFPLVALNTPVTILN